MWDAVPGTWGARRWTVDEWLGDRGPSILRRSAIRNCALAALAFCQYLIDLAYAWGGGASAEGCCCAAAGLLVIGRWPQ